MLVTFKKALLIPSYLQDIFSVKVTITNGAKVIFKENKNELRHKGGTKSNIHVHKDYSMTAEDKKNIMDSYRGCYDNHTWHKILSHGNFDNISGQQTQIYLLNDNDDDLPEEIKRKIPNRKNFLTSKLTFGYKLIPRRIAILEVTQNAKGTPSLFGGLYNLN